VQKALFFFLNVSKCAWCDVWAFTGYKFVVLSPIVATELLIGYEASYFSMVLFGAIYCYFHLKTMERFGSHSRLGNIHEAGGKVAFKTFCYANCAAQFFLIYWYSNV